MRNVKLNIGNKINIFRFYKYRPRIDGYVMQNLISNITDTFIGVSVIAKISIANQVEDNIRNKQMKNIRTSIGDRIKFFTRTDDCLKANVYNSVSDKTLNGVRDILKITIYSQIENELEKEHEEY